jgi:hypothetical protein
MGSSAIVGIWAIGDVYRVCTDSHCIGYTQKLCLSFWLIHRDGGLYNLIIVSPSQSAFVKDCTQYLNTDSVCSMTMTYCFNLCWWRNHWWLDIFSHTYTLWNKNQNAENVLSKSKTRSDDPCHSYSGFSVLLCINYSYVCQTSVKRRHQCACLIEERLELMWMTFARPGTMSHDITIVKTIYTSLVHLHLLIVTLLGYKSGFGAKITFARSESSCRRALYSQLCSCVLLNCSFQNFFVDS